MRLLLVTHRFLPRYLAGTEVYTGHLAQRLGQRGHTVRIFTGDPEATEPYQYEWLGLPVHAVPWRLARPAGPTATFLSTFANRFTERGFAAVCNAFRPEIVHFQHLMGLSGRLPGLARHSGARVVMTLHDYWFKCSNTWLYRYSHEPCAGPGLGYHCGGCALQRLGNPPQPLVMGLTAPIFVARTAWLNHVLRSADCIIAPSKMAASQFGRDKHVRDKLMIIPHGLPEADSRLSVPRPTGRPVRFAYLGPLIRPKGLHTILAAYRMLPDQEAAELHLYGNLLADPAYVAELRQMAPHPAVRFHGPVARDHVPAVLREADVLLVPTLLRETYSMVVDEAFAAGLPVVVADQCAAAERVIPEVNGLLAAAGEPAAWSGQMRRLLTEPGLLARLRAGVKPPNSLDDHLHAIEALYERVLHYAL